jgi:hypothetical protein
MDSIEKIEAFYPALNLRFSTLIRTEKNENGIYSSFGINAGFTDVKYYIVGIDIFRHPEISLTSSIGYLLHFRNLKIMPSIYGSIYNGRIKPRIMKNSRFIEDRFTLYGLNVSFFFTFQGFHKLPVFR